MVVDVVFTIISRVVVDVFFSITTIISNCCCFYSSSFDEFFSHQTSVIGSHESQTAVVHSVSQSSSNRCFFLCVSPSCTETYEYFVITVNYNEMRYVFEDDTETIMMIIIIVIVIEDNKVVNFNSVCGDDDDDYVCWWWHY